MAVIGRNNFEGVHVLRGRGADVAKAVVKILLGPRSSATGFMVAPTLMMTNNHVIASDEHARGAIVLFNYQHDSQRQLACTEACQIGSVIQTSPKRELDYTLARIKDGAQREWGCIPLRATVRYAVYTQAIVIQHPRGTPKMVARTSSFITAVGPTRIYYTTDTESDSSGSPVLDSGYRLLALHKGRGTLDQGQWKDNEGIRIDRIVADLRSAVDTTVLTELGV